MIFVDSSFWIGFAAARERRHGEALRLLRRNATESLVTTNHVVGETWTFLRKRYRHDVAMGFLDHARSADRLTLIFVSSELEDEAWEWLRRHDERPYSFVDSTSFAVMRRNRIQEAFTFDGDFTAAGFVELRPE